MGVGSTRGEIAQILERNCRLTHAEIGRMLDLEEAEVARTIDEMEQSGVITRYGAKINWDKLGEDYKVFATIGVQATPERGTGFDGIAERIMHFPEVHSLYLISGSHDFDVVIEGGSMRDIAHFVARRLATIPGVRGTATQFVLKIYKRDGDIFVEADDNDRLPVTP